MAETTRRRWLATVAAGLTACRSTALAAVDQDTPPACTLGIGTYSLGGLPLEECIGILGGLSYESIEIATQPGFDGEPSRMPAGRRKDVRARLAGTKLRLTAMMEHLAPAVADQQHAADLVRLKRVVELAHDLSPDRWPLLQTVLGEGEWEAKKGLFRDRLGDWLRLAQDSGMVFAIKPHRGGALSRPTEAIWLIRQLGDSSHLRMVYDYSHYAFRGMGVEETIREALPWTAHVVVKDAVERDGQVVFLLPGESGHFDYAGLLRLFYEGGYRGDVCCEVSRMIWSQPGYDAVAAARTCRRNMRRAFREAGVPSLRGGVGQG